MQYRIPDDIQIVALDINQPISDEVKALTAGPRAQANYEIESEGARSFAEDQHLQMNSGGFFIPVDISGFIAKAYSKDDVIIEGKMRKFSYSSTALSANRADLFRHDVKGYFACRPDQILTLRIWAKTQNLAMSYAAAKNSNPASEIFILPGSVRWVRASKAVYWQAEGLLAIPRLPGTATLASLTPEERNRLRVLVREKVSAELESNFETRVTEAVDQRLQALRTQLTSAIDLIGEIPTTSLAQAPATPEPAESPVPATPSLPTLDELFPDED